MTATNMYSNFGGKWSRPPFNKLLFGIGTSAIVASYQKLSISTSLYIHNKTKAKKSNAGIPPFPRARDSEQFQLAKMPLQLASKERLPETKRPFMTALTAGRDRS